MGIYKCIGYINLFLNMRLLHSSLFSSCELIYGLEGKQTTGGGDAVTPPMRFSSRSLQTHWPNYSSL